MILCNWIGVLFWKMPQYIGSLKCDSMSGNHTTYRKFVWCLSKFMCVLLRITQAKSSIFDYGYKTSVQKFNIYELLQNCKCKMLTLKLFFTKYMHSHHKTGLVKVLHFFCGFVPFAKCNHKVHQMNFRLICQTGQ